MIYERDLLLKEISDKTERAERRISLLSSLRGEALIVPPVNELRYAHYHLLRYTMDNDIAEGNKTLDHCKRALYDTYEVELLFHFKVFETFAQDYQKFEIISVVPQYIEWGATFENLRDIIYTCPRENRGEYYMRLEPMLPPIKAITDSLPAARQQINRRITNDQKRNFWKVTGVVISTLITIIGILLAYSST
ncbi:MAG: hypothetical protein AAB300_00025 [Nitrospirota bacterium]